MTNNPCEGCPIQEAYSRYVIESNFGEAEAAFEQTSHDLTSSNKKILRAMTEPPAVEQDVFTPKLRIVPMAEGCKGPRKRFFVFGKLTCRALLDFIPENR